MTLLNRLAAGPVAQPLRNTRRFLNLTQAQMAARLGIGHSTYARYEGLEAHGAVHLLPAWLTLAVAQLATEIK